MRQKVLTTMAWSMATIVVGSAFSTPAQAEPTRQQIERLWSNGSRVQVTSPTPPNPLPGQMAAPMPQSNSIQVLNEPDTGGVVHFLIDGQEKSLQAGESMNIAADRPHMVEFNTGGSRGDMRFSLYQGLYKFKVTEDGWGLYKSAGSATASSTTGANAAHTLPPGVPHPPLPAEDLRTRRMARREGNSAGGAPLKPADTSTGGRNETGTLPTPPAPGVIRERSSAPVVAPK